jgi:hypothetical protein
MHHSLNEKPTKKKLGVWPRLPDTPTPRLLSSWLCARA